MTWREAAQARCDAASPGPWKVFPIVLPMTDDGLREWPEGIPESRRTEYRIGTAEDDPQLKAPWPIVTTGHTPYYGTGTHVNITEADAVSIAHARTDLPRALALLREAETALEFIAGGYTIPGYKGEHADERIALLQEVIHGAQVTARTILAALRAEEA